jgi:S-(hydroxymethyl)glutathione dehydrogenase/alcohol dehydrogenase
VQPGDVVAVVGVGGLGSCAVQGARLAGAAHVIVIDPVEFKREKAMEFGATYSARSIADAEPMIRALTGGTMCDSVVMTMGVGDGRLVAGALALVGKGGVVVATNAHPEHETEVSLSMADLTLMEKRLVGCVFGGADARTDIPMLIGLYRSGALLVDELITRRYPLEDVNLGYADLHAGRNLRGVLTM